METHLSYLAWSALLCIVMWLPYVLERAQNWGLVAALGYPENPPDPAPWAQRLKKAHANMVENLAAFTALVLIAHVTDVDAGVGAALFFYGRLVHAIVYTLGLPYLRTAAFLVSWIGMVVIFFQVI